MYEFVLALSLLGLILGLLVILALILRFLINIIDPSWPCDAEGQHCEVIRVIAAHWKRGDQKKRGERDRIWKE